MYFNLGVPLIAGRNNQYRVGLFTVIAFAIAVAIPHAETADNILNKIWQPNYPAAFAEIAELPQTDSSACVLKGIAYSTRFDDLGDTLDLDSAYIALVKCKSSGFWESLRKYQIGFLHSLFGNTIKSISETRSAAQEFSLRSDFESQAFFAIYNYYAETLTNWLPFVESKSETYLANIKNGFEKSSRFSPLFGTTLAWMLYDKKQYAEALEISEALLKHYPNQPVFLQLKADMLYKLERKEEAIAIYEQSEKDYKMRAPNSTRYWCAVANLAIMTGDKKWKEKLQSQEFKNIKHLMPPSLL
ncbi:hypothetical protein AGMMS49938_16830 [Fibrobacterales bacterium]|nr:hypothetical protein AGMMS49938_16830 [Fibrobacterales bacterium]